jgi:[glutamine synthetase] adenylyltransferase / [glutamine synthetase]-adenylyl-L-tyrosine phosphorylase
VELVSLVERSAYPSAVRTALDRLDQATVDRIAETPDLAEAFVAVVAASRSATRLVETDPAALDVLEQARLTTPIGPVEGPGPAGPGAGGSDGVVGARDPDDLARAKRLAQLRITARDLLGEATLEDTTAALSDLGAAVLAAAVRLAGVGDLAVIGMGKLGGRELNYASDVDVMFVGGDARGARAVMDIARRCFRVDANLRPEGRDGALTRSLDSYRNYWDRWAQPWEFQALLKAVPVAGDPTIGGEWADAAAAAVWDRRLSQDDLRSL